MAKGKDPVKDARRRRAQRARDNYRKEAERKRAERMKGKDLKVPPFDPKKFIEQERARSKAMLHAIFYAAFVTFALVGVGELIGAQLVMSLIALLMIGTLYPYMKYVWDIDMTKLGRWSAPLGMWFGYFITFMMVSFIMSNPPFIDYAAPHIVCCDYYEPTNNTSAPWAQVKASNVSVAGGEVRIVAHVIDNHHVANVQIQFADPSGSFSAYAEMTRGAGDQWEYVLSPIELNAYTIFLRATDDAGHLTEARSSMLVV